MTFILIGLLLWIQTLLRWHVHDTTLCDKVCQWLAPGRWFSPCTPISSPNKTDHTDITKIVESGTKHHKLKPILIGLSIFWLDMVKQIDIYECIKSIKYQILVFWILTKAIESSSHAPLSLGYSSRKTSL